MAAEIYYYFVSAFQKRYSITIAQSYSFYKVYFAAITGFKMMVFSTSHPPAQLHFAIQLVRWQQ